MSDTYRLVSAQVRANAVQAVSSAPDGHIVTVVKATRNSPQNRRFHAMIGDLKRAKPEGRDLTTDSWKVLLMDLAAKISDDPRPFHMRTHTALDGDGVVIIGPKTSRLKVGEFAELISVAKLYGDKFGVVWSEPNPYE
jgi:NinB protein